jgi:hypothetical protein
METNAHESRTVVSAVLVAMQQCGKHLCSSESTRNNAWELAAKRQGSPHHWKFSEVHIGP